MMMLCVEKQISHWQKKVNWLPLAGFCSLGIISTRQVSLNDVSKQILAPNCNRWKKEINGSFNQMNEMTYHVELPWMKSIRNFIMVITGLHET